MPEFFLFFRLNPELSEGNTDLLRTIELYGGSLYPV